MTTPVDMSVTLGPLDLDSPVLVASGTFGSGREYADLADLDALGAVVTKGVSPTAWAGNPSPRIAETASGMLNSIGLQNPGVEAFCADALPWLREQGAHVIVNVAGHSVADYVGVVGRLEDEDGIDAYELNVSCPNVDAGGMAFGTSCDGIDAVMSAVRPLTSRPLIVKLTPNVTDIVEIAKAARAAGADVLSLINTLLGMAIDAGSRRPRLARVVGGLSGPAVKPVALRMVWQVASSVDVPVIGMGGVADGEDAVEFMLAGASAVAVGTANFVDPAATTKVRDGIATYCERNGVTAVRDIVGTLEVDR